MASTECPTCSACQRLVIQSVGNQLRALISLVDRGDGPYGKTLAVRIHAALAEIPPSLLPIIDAEALISLRSELLDAITELEQRDFPAAAMRLRTAAAAWQATAFHPLDSFSGEASSGIT